jgi:hypothetical protein
MKRITKQMIGILSLFIFNSCGNNDNKIIRLLNSEHKDDVISGAYMAGESSNKQFVPLLLKNANDVRTSTNLRFL